MAEKRGIFGLNDYIDRIIEGKTDTPDDVLLYPAGSFVPGPNIPNFAHVAGGAANARSNTHFGYIPGNVDLSSILKLDFSTDTYTSVGNLPYSAESIIGASSLANSYFISGAGAGSGSSSHDSGYPNPKPYGVDIKSSIVKCNYSTGAVSVFPSIGKLLLNTSQEGKNNTTYATYATWRLASAQGSFTNDDTFKTDAKRLGGTAVGTIEKTYIAGGMLSGSTEYSGVEDLFPETTSMSVLDGYTHQYAVSGSTYHKLEYSRDTISVLPGKTNFKAGNASFGNQEKGYFTGPSDGTYYASSLSFFNDSASETNRLTYSTETDSRVPSLTLSQDNLFGNDGSFRATSGNEFYGYLMSNANLPNIGSVYKTSYSTESWITVTTLPQVSSNAPRGGGGASSTGDGYAIGGFYSSTFPSNTEVGYGSRLPRHLTYPPVLQAVNSSTFKINYTTDTASLTSYLPQGRRKPGSTSAFQHGVPASGIIDPIGSGDAIKYVDGSPATPPAPTLTRGSLFTNTIKNTKKAVYVGGGFNGQAQLRVDYKIRSEWPQTPTNNPPYLGFNPAGATVPSGSAPIAKFDEDKGWQLSTSLKDLSAGRSLVASLTSFSDGYFSGGQRDRSSVYSNSERVNYSTETLSAVPGANMSQAKYGSGGLGDHLAGRIIGGGNTYGTEFDERVVGYWDTFKCPQKSNSDKLTFSTNTTSSIPNSAPLANHAAQRLLTFGDTQQGYYGFEYTFKQYNSTLPVGGGGVYLGDFHSANEKITYSTDTHSTVPGINLYISNTYLTSTPTNPTANSITPFSLGTAAGNGTYAYIQSGGVSAGVVNYFANVVVTTAWSNVAMQRFTHSTESLYILPSANPRFEISPDNERVGQPTGRFSWATQDKAIFGSGSISVDQGGYFPSHGFSLGQKVWEIPFATDATNLNTFATIPMAFGSSCAVCGNGLPGAPGADENRGLDTIEFERPPIL